VTPTWKEIGWEFGRREHSTSEAAHAGLKSRHRVRPLQRANRAYPLSEYSPLQLVHPIALTNRT